MEKQNAALDASFWINACHGQIAEFISQYFWIHAPALVAQEIRYPFTVLGMQAQSVRLFDKQVSEGNITIVDPKTPVKWFQEGENATIGLAIERHWFLLIDDANPYHRAKAFALKVVGTTEFTVLLFDHNKIDYETAVLAIKSTNCSKPQKRQGWLALELLARRKQGA